MKNDPVRTKISRRRILGSAGKAAAASLVLPSLVPELFVSAAIGSEPGILNSAAGPDRVTVLPGKTYLMGWVGFPDTEKAGGAPAYPGPPPAALDTGMAEGVNPHSRTYYLSRATAAEADASWLSINLERGWGAPQESRLLTVSMEASTLPPGEYHAVITVKGTPDRAIPVNLSIVPVTYGWSKQSGPGTVQFADPNALVTTVDFPVPGDYVLVLKAGSGEATASSTLNVTVETPPPAKQLGAVYTRDFKIDSPLWNSRAKALMARWIPHCIDQINRTDLTQGQGGIDNFIEAAKALRGEPHDAHKGYVFSNAWVHQTVESMSISLMIDPQGDPDILKAHEKMRATLEDWIPKILAAQHPDGYLQTAFTLRDPRRWPDRWTPDGRSNHEGYVAGYFIESAINHYLMTGMKDARLYDAAKKLADCWCDNLGPPPKKEWFDGHQEMEQALVRFGRFVNDMEGGSRGDRYIRLARFLLDCRKDGSEYDQSHLPVTRQYEAVGHAVRAVYTYSGMADVAVETHDFDYRSAVRSLWNNIVQKKYYLTGGVGSGETSEGFGPNYSLRNNGYCESCSTCGAIFFHWKMNLMYHDARYADHYELAMYNALLGSIDLEGNNFYYDNPLSADSPRYPWHACPCCVGNIPRTLLMMPTWTYAKSGDGVYINLFIGSTITVQDVDGIDVEMAQKTDYPWDGKVSLKVNPKTAKKFSVHIRIPNRNIGTLYTNTPEVNGIDSLSVNGSPVKPVVNRGYAVVERTWNRGDTIDLSLPMTIQRVKADPRIAADRGKVALRLGPLVYNIEQADQDITGALSPEAPLATEWKPGLLGGVVVIKGQFKDGSPMTAIPNFARMNRGPAPPPTPPGQRPAARPPASIVWITEG